jgi:anti-sigma28 factor (negative regulator of flagellin synthesis)
MSIRIQNDNLAGTQASETSRANEISRAGSSSSARAGKAGGGADHVEISSLSEGISAANSAQQTQQAARVRQLAALYSSGRYHVDSTAVGKAIVANAISQGGGSE